MYRELALNVKSESKRQWQAKNLFITEKATELVKNSPDNLPIELKLYNELKDFRFIERNIKQDWSVVVTNEAGFSEEDKLWNYVDKW